MKTLLLIRHAKSSWAEPGLSDFDRPLNERGKRDAPEMARRIADRNMTIDLLLSSPAKRAKKTATLFSRELAYDPESILFIPELYLAGINDFRKAIAGMEDRYNTIAIFSHNPGITEFANTLCSVKIDDMPTCAIFAVSSDSHKWQDFESSSKQFIFFDYPKAAGY